MRSITVGLCLFASLSLAQQPAPTPKPQNVSFTDTDVSAERAIPIGEIYVGSPRPIFKSLIRLRMNFNDKLQESVHEM